MRPTVARRTARLAFALALTQACAPASPPVDDALSADASDDTSQPADAATDAPPAPDAAPRDGGVYRANYPVTARFPEGGAFDRTDQAFYVGSLGDGSVHRVSLTTGEETELFRETAAGHWWTLGMDVDVARRRLWVCAMDDRSPSPRAGHIWIFDLATGMRVANHALSMASADATCTDVAVASDGVGYAVDRERPIVYRVTVDAAPTMFVTDPALGGALAGQNAVVALPDDSALLIAVYSPPSLVRVGLADRTVRAVTLTGMFRDPTPLGGADGLAYYDGSAWVAFTNRLVRVRPSMPDWSAGTATFVTVPEGGTDVIATPSELYLLNGQAVRFATMQAPAPFALTRFDGAL